MIQVEAKSDLGRWRNWLTGFLGARVCTGYEYVLVRYRLSLLLLSYLFLLSLLFLNINMTSQKQNKQNKKCTGDVHFFYFHNDVIYLINFYENGSLKTLTKVWKHNRRWSIQHITQTRYGIVTRSNKIYQFVPNSTLRFFGKFWQQL